MSTDSFCWNLRGLNKFSHRSGLRKWFRKNTPLFGGLLETHVKEIKMNKFVPENFPGWSSVANYGFSPLGKIWIIWHPSLLVNVISISLQMITVEVTWPSSLCKVFISVVYASNDVGQRSELWKEITALATSFGFNTKPWLVLGDFN